MHKSNSMNQLDRRNLSYVADVCMKRLPSACFGGKSHGRLVYTTDIENASPSQKEGLLPTTIFRSSGDNYWHEGIPLLHTFVKNSVMCVTSAPRNFMPAETRARLTDGTGTISNYTSDTMIRCHQGYNSRKRRGKNILLCNAADNDLVGECPALSLIGENASPSPISSMKQHRSQLFQSFILYVPGIDKQIRCYSTAKQMSPTHYYDVLGLTPKASSKEIKSAYYSLSKLYHPDLKNDDASEARFAEISEAYEVLGNKRKKRLYDRGFMNPLDPRSGHAASQVDDDIDEDILRGRGHFRKRGPIQTGRSQIYNFDEFYQQHYGETLKKSRVHKKTQEMQTKAIKSFNTRSILGVCGAAFVVGIALIGMIIK